MIGIILCIRLVDGHILPPVINVGHSLDLVVLGHKGSLKNGSTVAGSENSEKNGSDNLEGLETSDMHLFFSKFFYSCLINLKCHINFMIIKDAN